MSRLIDVAAVLESMAKALDGTEQGAACEFAVRLMREKQEKHPDTERIDWLESHPSKYNWGVTLDHCCVFAARNTTSGHATLREAIDAARKP